MTLGNNNHSLCPYAGWSSLVARQAHNLKVVGSNPTPATNLPTFYLVFSLFFFKFFVQMHLTKLEKSLVILLLKIRLIRPLIVH